ncbi:Cytochrome P450 71A1 [Ananas comosus]|uniref:Cytochrome P450 71A1 n=1 Tax=Ananas comosus TaxID=4615 RepID=A0A199VMX2_ANACO|nr:Cytochrome P450 71A1 [Ananas comosus]
MAHELMYGARDVAFAPYGEYWRQVRRTCVLHLLSLRRVRSLRPVREEESALMVREIARLAELGAEFNVSELVVRLTNDIVCRAAFGRKYGGGGAGAEGGVGAVREALAEFVRLLGTVQIGEFVAGVGWIERWWRGLDRRVGTTARALDGFLERVLEDHRREGGWGDEMDGRDCDDGWGGGDDDDRQMDGRDLVDVLLAVEKEDKELGDMFAAGTDTTYTTIEWAMTELINHPEKMKKLRDEVRSVVGTDRMVLEEDLNNMAYLKAVIKETLRLHPPFPLLVPRESIEDTNLMGYHIPAKTRVIINAWAIGRDPESWERPEEFSPERFLDSLIDYRGQDFQFIPFGAGRRGCPGINFAMPTAELALANLVHRFDWELPGRIKEEKMDCSEVNGITVHLKSRLVLVAKLWCS